MQSSSPALFKAVVVTSVLATVLLASNFPAQADEAATELDKVVVTAARTTQTQDQTLAAITVIERVDIERLQPSSLPDLLRGLPGVSLSNNGGPGKATALFLRGTESDHVLVLVDGLKIGSATSGGAALQDIPVEQIERIEIVRGPFSSLYGSEAIGGVIQIFTRQPQGAFAPTFSVGVGSFDTRRASLGIAGRGDTTDGRGGWYSINAAHEGTDGIDAFRGNPALVRPERYRDPDRDGYRNNSLTLQGGYRFSDAWDADARVLRAEGHNEYDGSLNNQADSVQQAAGARLRFAPGDRLAFTAHAGGSADLSDAFLNGVYSSTFDTRRKQGSLQVDIGAAANLLSVGFDWQRDEVDSSTRYAVERRSNRGLFGQWQQAFDAHALQASVRRDENSQFGGKTTGSALWGWDASQALRFTASAGTAFKAPTFNELYFPGYGNPLLQPETSRSVELGARGRHGWGGWSLNGFDTRIDDLIAYDSTLGPFGGPNNIDRARIRGVEATVNAEFAGWAVQGSASWLDPRNDGSGSAQDKVLPRRARETARIDGDRRFGAFGLGASITASGERFDDLANKRRMGGYALTDLRLSYAMGEAWSVQLAANNVFDRHYETAAFYRQPGRNYLLTLRYRPAR